MNSPSAQLQAAIQSHRAGQLDAAEAGYRQVIAAEPGRHAAWYYLGMLLQQRGQRAAAIEFVQRAAELQATQPVYHASLADLMIAQGNLAGAAAHLQRAIELKPGDIAALKKYGAVLQHRGEFERAIDFYRQALAREPGAVVLQTDLGVALLNTQQPDAAAGCFRAVIAAQPDNASAHFNLGIALAETGQGDESVACYRRAIDLQPSYAEAHCNLANDFYVRGNMAAAEQHYRAAVQYKPERALYHANLGSVLLDEGKLEEGLAAYDRAIAIEPHDGYRIRASLAAPLIPSSADELHAARYRLEQNVARLLEEPLALADPPREVASTAFYLSYHGRNNRQIFSDIARLFANAAPVLNFVAPHCQPGVRREHATLKIGFLSKHFYHHVVSQYFRSLIAGLAKHFDVTLIRPGGPNDAVSQSMENSAARVVRLSHQLTVAQQQVAAAELDVLIYADIGMDPLTYFLAFARLAPVQANLMGHPDTSGIPAIDYYLSSAAQEPDNGDDFYSERLVRLQHLPLCFERPGDVDPLKTRRDFGLPDDRRLYFCGQTLFKIHPEFDELLSRILHSDPQGMVVLVAGHQEHWTKLLRERLARTIPLEISRLTILPRQSLDDFRQLLSLSDVVLDTIHFNGGTTTFETLARGAPLVTLPGTMMRSRQTLAAYRTMGVLDCVAQDADDYVRLAVRLANDRPWRNEVREKILATCDRLFGDHGIVAEVASWIRIVGRGAGEWRD